MKHRFLIILLVILSLTCKKSANPLKPDPDCIPADLVLSQTYRPGAAESFLRLTAENIRFPDSVAIIRNGNPAFMLHLTGGDTCFYDEGLLPNTTYAYRAVYFRPRSQTDSSNVVTLTTMDTTGHDFSWEVMNFGTGAGSTLNDVAIIDENNIWAVGEIHITGYDSLGHYYDSSYNAVHWDGVQWELTRIRTNACGGVEYPAGKAVFSFSETDIIFSHIDGSLTYYDGNEFVNDCSLITQFNGSANEIWGQSKNHFYVVSGNGFIAYYNGNTWTRLHSGTDLPIQDIWGAVDPLTGEEVVLCVASRRDLNFGCKLFKIEGNVVKEISSEGLSWKLSLIWFMPGRFYIIAGAGVYPTYLLNMIWQKETSFPLYYTRAVRGKNMNEIIIAGSYGLISHYNGTNWKHFSDDESPAYYGEFFAVDIFQEMAVAVGSEGNNDILIIGRRN